MTEPRPDVRLRPWLEGDLDLLERLLGDPAMTVHLGGPESAEALAARHARYLALPEAGGVFAVTAGPDAAAGWAGYWESEWRGEAVWECGWSTLPEWQRQGVATAAGLLLIEQVRAAGGPRRLLAFPAAGNAPSNGVCRALGFDFLGEEEVEYPRGTMMRSCVWRLELRDGGPAA